MPRFRSAAEREYQLNRIKKVLREDPLLSDAQIKERFLQASMLVGIARKQLREEGVKFPDPKSAKGVTCYR